MPGPAWAGSGARLEGVRTFLVSRAQGRVFEITRDGLFERGYDGVPAELQTDGFVFGEFEGSRFVAVSIDSTLEALEGELAEDETVRRFVAFTLHEAFHGLLQDELVSADRGFRSPYPGPGEPRFLRAALTVALEDAARGAELGPAAYWQARYETEWPDDAERWRRTDQIEGSAEYFAMMAGSLGLLGCGATDAELEAVIVTNLQHWVRFVRQWTCGSRTTSVRFPVSRCGKPNARAGRRRSKPARPWSSADTIELEAGSY